MSEPVQTETIQARGQPRDEVNDGSSFGPALVQWITRAGELLPPWWSRERDQELRKFWKQSDHMSSAIYRLAAKFATVPVHVEPRDPSVKTHWKQAEKFEQNLIEVSEFYAGYTTMVTKWLIDRWTQDNGAFLEVIGEGKKDQPIVGAALGLAHLDSGRCFRTGNPEFPVVYLDTTGRRYKLHRTRVVESAEMSSPIVEMNGVGFCALSRTANNVQHLVDIATYEQEKLGSRPTRSIMVTQGGLDPDDVKSAFASARMSMDDRGLSRFSQSVVMGGREAPDANIVTIDLASLPDGFDKQTDITLGMFGMSLAFGVPPRWLWPATQSGATKADAMYSHIAGIGGGVGLALGTLVYLLGGDPDSPSHLSGKFLPPHLKLVYDFQDDEQDRMVGEIRKLRADRRKTDLEVQVIDTRVAREQALSVGDLTDSQFQYLELEDGRLPDGNDVLSLFSSVEDIFIRLLDLGVEEPLAIDLNDPVDMIGEIELAALETQDLIVNAPSAETKRKAQQAFSALGKLKEMYSTILSQQVQAELMAQMQEAEDEGQVRPEQPEEEVEGEEPEEGEEEETGQRSSQEETQEMNQSSEDQEEKSFNFGAKVGEVIRGNLARGPGGQFISADKLSGSLLAGLLDRLRARSKGERLSAAERKRGENREMVLSKMEGKLSRGTLDGLSALRSGDQPSATDAIRLQDQGLVDIGSDGTVTMTTAGRKVLRSANSGDVDGVVSGLQDAKKPKKGKKGGGGRKDPEAERLRNQAMIGQVLENEIDPELFGDMVQFSRGKTIDEGSLSKLAGSGLVEFDSTGIARMTGSGRKLINASSRGDGRSAMDALSEGRDRVERTRQRIERLDDKLTEFDDSLQEIQVQTADLLENQLAIQAQLARTDLDDGTKAELQERLTNLEDDLQELTDRSEETQSRIEDLRTQIEDYRRQIGEEAVKDVRD